MQVADNLTNIQTTIQTACDKCKRNTSEITIIGVTKYVTIERTEEALQAGIQNLGENRLEGFYEKYEHFRERAKWHFIGTLQSRKVKDVIDKVDFIHSLDRTSLAKEINKRSEKPVNCFIQVNVSGEESKHGIELSEVESFISTLSVYPNIHVVGLMTMAPHTDDQELLRQTFRLLRETRDRISSKQLSSAPCTYLSMGMSNDYQIAVEEGATHIRIGSNLVGSKTSEV
ncbi:YggS family pyridoxal phosphate-dependent enzyme [Virgibacillus phasianinus]|uniref:YggS family pyridoxal phosphate-dependent enzyme n=1 Tax=Virgibacillus phasianinus TaxID=2017483 RepID=UPI00156068F8|nr:YggS family pyridoxal phosphate-dependent enzyme [Virgibacillus phasianinus]